MQRGEAVFIDSAAFVALAVPSDGLHAQALEHLELLENARARLYTSVPVVIETFTFLERNAYRDMALSWKDSLHERGVVKILPCELRDLQACWDYFRMDLRKLSAVDATSFAIMKRANIRVAFTFDHHFAAAGFKLVA